jgi:phage terminase large subunit-like protein
MESGGFAGSRNDFCWFDDPLSENTVGTEESIAKTIKKYDAIRKLSEVGALGALTTLTPWAVNDLGAELQLRNEAAEKDGDFNFLAYRIDPAFVIKTEALAKAKDNLLALTEEDVVLRFRRLNWKFLRSEMMSGRAENFKFFKAQSLCRWDSLDDEQTRCSFTMEDLMAHTKPLSEFEPNISHTVIDLVLSIDVAPTTQRYSDLSALALTAICHWNGKTVAIVKDLHMGRHKHPELAILIAEAMHRHQPTKVVIEKGGMSEVLRDEIHKAAMLRGYILNPIYWRAANLGGAAAKSKSLRIKTTCESMLHNDELYFVQAPWNAELFQQFVNFDGVSDSRTKKNDGPDAISIGLEVAMPSQLNSKDSKEREKQAEFERNAMARRMMYDMMFGSGSPASAPTFEPTPDHNQRGNWGIPRALRTGTQAPRQQVGFGSIMPKKQQ